MIKIRLLVFDDPEIYNFAECEKLLSDLFGQEVLIDVTFESPENRLDEDLVYYISKWTSGQALEASLATVTGVIVGNNLGSGLGKVRLLDRTLITSNRISTDEQAKYEDLKFRHFADRGNFDAIVEFLKDITRPMAI
jgi:hypothetical protein